MKGLYSIRDKGSFFAAYSSVKKYLKWTAVPSEWYCKDFQETIEEVNVYLMEIVKFKT